MPKINIVDFATYRMAAKVTRECSPRHIAFERNMLVCDFDDLDDPDTRAIIARLVVKQLRKTTEEDILKLIQLARQKERGPA